MAEEASEVPQSIEVVDPVSAQDMELETGCPGNPIDSSAENQSNGVEKHEENDDGGLKRGREEGGDAEDEDEVLKKRKVERSMEEERLEKLEEKKEGGVEKEEGGGEDDKEPDNVGLGPKVFGSSVEMFDYFYKFLHFWSPNTNINKYEYMVLLDLLKKGHAEADKKIGEGIQAFQVRYHPMWRSRCFFLVRVDGSSDDFSFRKCINHILPLPESMMSHIAPVGVNNGKSDGKKNGGHHKGGGGGSHGGGGGRGGRGGRWRGRRGGK